MGQFHIEQIYQKDIADTLSKIWHSKAEIARKAVNRLGIVFQYGAAMGLRRRSKCCCQGKGAIGQEPAQATNIPALHWSEVQEFYKSISENTVTNLALRLLILTGVRCFALRNILVN